MKTNGDVKLQRGAMENTLNCLTPWRQLLRNKAHWKGEALKTARLKGDEEEVEKWDLISGGDVRFGWSCDELSVCWDSEVAPAEMSLLLTNLHLDKAIKSLSECN